jgi:hypothetical protein
MAMHPDTLALLLARIRTEIEDARYGAKSPAEIANLLNQPVVTVLPPVRRNVLISDVKGYLAARLVIVRMRRDVPSLTGTVRDIAEALLDILVDTQLREFLTAEDAKRGNVLQMFGALVASGTGGLTAEHLADIEAMTLAPAGPPIVEPPRWQMIIDGIAGIDNAPGPPNAADADLIQEAINGGG